MVSFGDWRENDRRSNSVWRISFIVDLFYGLSCSRVVWELCESVPQDLGFKILFVTVLCWDCSQVFFFIFFHLFIRFLNFSSCSNIWLCISFGSSVKSWNFLLRRAMFSSSKLKSNWAIEYVFKVCIFLLRLFTIQVRFSSMSNCLSAR